MKIMKLDGRLSNPYSFQSASVFSDFVSKPLLLCVSVLIFFRHNIHYDLSIFFVYSAEWLGDFAGAMRSSENPSQTLLFAPWHLNI